MCLKCCLITIITTLLDGYYQAFSRTIKNKGKDVTPFLEFSLEGVVESLMDMKGRITVLIKRFVFREVLAQLKDQKEITIRQFSLLSFLLDAPRDFSLNDLMNERPFSLFYKKVTKQTARRDLTRLLELNLVEEVEEGRYFLDSNGVHEATSLKRAKESKKPGI